MAVFTINDIDLEIAPEALSIQKEDLVYNYKVLRSKASTKIPSGHGQILVQARIPIMDIQILTAHRLLVELRHSPFCFIENEYLRSSIVPDWPILPVAQKMVFTVLSVDLAPYGGTSDAWVLSLELSWFNYFPYTHNWLYRRDWVTQWINNNGVFVKTTIGWDIDSNGTKTGQRVNIVDVRATTENAVQDWSSAQNSYTEREIKTIDDLIALHHGEIYDLQPLPSVMEMTDYVHQPSQSLIYKRYINFLQRDALLKNFGIDIEFDLKRQTTDTLHRLVFSAVKDSNDITETISLQQALLPESFQEYQSAWNILREDWIHRILLFNSLGDSNTTPSIEFTFCTYKSIALPSNVATALYKAQADARDKYKDTTKPSLENRIFLYKGENLSEGLSVRQGASEPNGLHTPIGNEHGKPLTFAQLTKKQSDRIRWRPAKERQAQRSSVEPINGGFHYGMDVSTRIDNDTRYVGLPVYAMKAGIVQVATQTFASVGSVWKELYLNQDNLWVLKKTDPQTDTKFQQVLQWAHNNNKLPLDSNGQQQDNPGPGYVINPPVSISHSIYYSDISNDAGLRIEILHDGDNERSHYYHLGVVLVPKGHHVEAGQQIGTTGSTSRLTPSEVIKLAQSHSSNVSRLNLQPYYSPQAASQEEENLYSLPPHLHVEFWEKIEWHSERNYPVPDGVQETYSRRTGWRVVDLTTTWSDTKYADQTIINAPPPTSVPVTAEAVKEAIEKDKSTTQEEKTTLVQVLDHMHSQGWYYYDQQEDVTNIWWKPWTISIQSKNLDHPDLNKELELHGIVLTNVNAGLRHIVANIPILGHEYPTQQHLGSIEPYYNFEFHLLDDQHTLEGIGKGGTALEAMRQILQQNSRKFRIIPDSWAMITDSFLTRLFGTTQIDDLKLSESEGFVNNFRMNRRSMITRAQSETIEGNPGLSRLLFEVQETNPYTQEALELTAATLPEAEVAREKILKAVYNLDFRADIKDKLLKVLVAKATGTNVTDPSQANFGKIVLPNVYTMNEEKDLFYAYTEDHPTIYGNQTSGLQQLPDLTAVQDDTGQIVQLLGVLGIPFTLAEEYDRPTRGYTTNIERTIPKNLIQAGSIIFDPNALGLTGYLMNNGATIEYDLASVINNDGTYNLLIDVPFEKIYQYRVAILKVLTSADMYLSEEKELLQRGSLIGEPLTKNVIHETLYNLPVNPRLWRTFQYYLSQTAKEHYWPSLTAWGASGSYTSGIAPIRGNAATVDTLLRANPNWLVWSEEINEKDFNYIPTLSIQDGSIELLESIVSLAWGLGPIGAWFDLAFAYTENAFDSISGNFWQQASMQATEYVKSVQNVHNLILREYIHTLPIYSLALSEYFKDTLSDSILGDIFGVLKGSDGLPALATTKELLRYTVISSGHYGRNPFVHEAPFFVEPLTDSTLQNRLFTTDSFTDSSINDFNQLYTLSAFNANSLNERANTYYAFNEKNKYIEALKKIDANPLLYYTSGQAREIFWDWMKLPRPGSEFIWPVNAGAEKEKLDYFKNLLARLADQLIYDPAVLKAFGLDDLISTFARPSLKGKECLPDMDLPWHPYYGDKYSTPPDFYFWNIYEDGDVFNSTFIQEVTRTSEEILTRCYNSLKRLQSGEVYNSAKDKYVNEPDSDAAVDLNIRYHAEATDTSTTGPTDYPFYPNPESSTYKDDWLKNYNKATTSATTIQTRNKAGEIRGSSTATNVLQKARRDIYDTSTKAGLNPVGIRLANTEGFYGLGGGLNYPTRLSPEQYNKLRTTVNSVQQMFGSRAGYLKETLPEAIQDRLNGTPLKPSLMPTHKFDLEYLKELSALSTSDLYSQQLRIQRAYPTFKLYFIEEDSFENALLSFDDFYSYNGVKDFTVTISRKDPIDTAVITLQNVSGILDGTKRDAVADLDYILKKKERGDKAVNNNTAADQPFGALVMRPGLNIQLRVGYSNDPNLLSVLLNGRVVDVQWNQQADTTQILVQGFGAELTQVLKGTDPINNDVVYYTTHHLLAAMMLEPEVVHFGRWQIGRQFQHGEANDVKYDFRDYTQDKFLGAFDLTSKTMKALYHHPLLMYGLALGGAALLSRLPFISTMFKLPTRWLAGRPIAGKLLGLSWIEGLATRLGIVGSLGTEGFERILVRAIGSRTSGLVTRETLVIAGSAEEKIIQEALEASLGSLRTRASQIAAREVVDQVAFQQTLNDAIIKALSGLSSQRTIANFAQHAAEAEAVILSHMLKGFWLKNPATQATGWDLLKEVAFKGRYDRILRGLTTGVFITMGAAGITGVGLDGLEEIVKSIDLIEQTEAYYQANTASLFLSPQDDNLYVPHPKDYMILEKKWQERAKEWAVQLGANLTGSPDLSNFATRYFLDKKPYEKKQYVDSYQYKVTTSYIWDVFHEMALRHPGWIYGIRPYGTEFRYTMFFGIPSQRYWSKPVPNDFIHRSNQLDEFIQLKDENQIILRYQALYGDVFNGQPLQQFIDNQRALNSTRAAITSGEAQPISELLQAPALKEYLTALDQRFVPFRRYHRVSSETNLVWNGIISSENATYNAVDVTYFGEDPEDIKAGPLGSTIIKAHPLMPEASLRVLPLEQMPNCRGYVMAMRYGMGQLLLTLRDMYRGELVLLGNPRINPWDICILQDSYNSMVGPFEVEQVTHNFSYETGYITEVKPSAVVIANETSSWPILEAMKMVSLAITAKDGSADLGKGVFVGRGPYAGTESDELLRAKLIEQFGPDYQKTLTDAINVANKVPAELQQVFDSVADLQAGAANALDWAATIDFLQAGSALATGAGIALLSRGNPLVTPNTLKTLRIMTGLGVGTNLIAAGAEVSLAAGIREFQLPHFAYLLGGGIFMLQCLRGDTAMMIPLMKNGYPLATGFNYHDPSVVWKNFLGDLGRHVDDVFDGSRDLINLWQLYGMDSWRRLSDWNAITKDSDQVLQGTNTTGGN